MRAKTSETDRAPRASRPPKRKSVQTGGRKPTPLPDPTIVNAGELAKSGDTRRRILDAAIHCLATLGYSGANAVTVAERAGLTRPALLYHFPSRLALIEASIHYVIQSRINLFEETVQRLASGGVDLHDAIDAAWSQNQTTLYHAYCELANAARTDPDLAAIFEPAMDVYDAARRSSASKLFSPSQQQAAGFHVRRDVTRFLLDGLATHGWITENAQARKDALLTFLKMLMTDPNAEALLSKVAEKCDERGRDTRTKPRKAD